MILTNEQKLQIYAAALNGRCAAALKGFKFSIIAQEAFNIAQCMILHIESEGGSFEGEHPNDSNGH